MLTSATQVPMRAGGEMNTSPSSGTVAVVPPTGDEHKVRYGFLIGSLGFLVGNQTVAEVIISSSIYPVPRIPEWLRGIMNHAGNIIPVFDLRHILAPGDTRNDRRPILVLGRDADAVGLLVDGLPKVLPVTTVTTESFDMPALPAIAKDYITPAFRSNDSCWMELDYKNMLKRLVKEYEKYGA